MRIPVKVRLAVDVIRYLKSVEDDRARRVEDMAVMFGTSKNFLHQVVSMLSRYQLISVIKGPRGGCRSGIKDTNLRELHEIFGYIDERPIDEKLPSASIEKSILEFFSEIVI